MTLHVSLICIEFASLHQHVFKERPRHAGGEAREGLFCAADCFRRLLMVGEGQEEGSCKKCSEFTNKVILEKVCKMWKMFEGESGEMKKSPLVM